MKFGPEIDLGILGAFKIVAGWVTPKGWLTRLQLRYSIRIHATILNAPRITLKGIFKVKCITFKKLL
jgi:hypothetical protein